ncbi:hypothetical protein EJG51_009640 [Undibacterium piscinae]|uniref:TolC family protein n=1 Tax=Undibacterium piscinae TaxID=2495591 RepID=A0A6M4AAE0_9BURK|nr:hypothetical protein EJG51_009640 [Undibacterium piscinae]
MDLFGANAATQDSLLARLSAREYEWHDARISLAAEVANTYLQLRGADARRASNLEFAKNHSAPVSGKKALPMSWCSKRPCWRA